MSLHDDHICFFKVCIPPVPNFLVISLSLPPSLLPRGGVTRQGVVLTDLITTFSHFVIVNKTPLPPPCLVTGDTPLPAFSWTASTCIYALYLPKTSLLLLRSHSLTHTIAQHPHSHTQSPNPHTRILSALPPPGHTLFSTPPVLSASHSGMFNISSWSVHALLVLHRFHHRYAKARCIIVVVHSQAFSALSSPQQR